MCGCAEVHGTRVCRTEQLGSAAAAIGTFATPEPRCVIRQIISRSSTALAKRLAQDRGRKPADPDWWPANNGLRICYAVREDPDRFSWAC